MMSATPPSMQLWPLLAIFASFVRAQDRETFYEQLWIEPFQDGKLLAQFEFLTVLKDVPRRPDTLSIEDSSQHYIVVPLALGQILREYSVTELHLSLNAGKWNYKTWGVPLVPSVASGAELWAWMGHTHNETTEAIDARWHGLTNALAGLFCASLGSMDARRTITPEVAFRPEGDLPRDYPHSLRYAAMPSENVCTENLTPFVKLLPCKAHAGIASLLNPHRLFDADWHGMSITVRWLENTGIELRLGFDWSFQSLFGRGLHKSCLIASKSKVLVGMGPTSEGSALLPYGHKLLKMSDTRSLAVYDVSHNKEEFQLSQQWVDEKVFSYGPVSPQLPITVRRVLTGAEQTHGGLLLSITNEGNTEFTTAWLETMPWFIQFFLYTLELRVDGQKRGDTLQVTVSFRKAFILYTEHPPDAHRGWDLPAAVITPLCAEADSKTMELTHRYGLGLVDTCGTRLYTSTLLVDLATPDFSMPYNVIIMTSTVVALFFGSIFNLLTRKFVISDSPRSVYRTTIALMKSEQLRVAYLGPQGTYSHQAAAAAFKNAPATFLPCKTISHTFEAVCEDRVEFSCIPLENSLHGSVIETLDLLRVDRPLERAVSITSEFTIGIEHCLIACRGVRIEDITRVLSHEQALGQCHDFLSTHLPNVAQVRTASTASAAEHLLELSAKGDSLARCSAAICSRICVDMHKELELVQNGIQDGEINFTRFIILSKIPLPAQIRLPTLQRALLRCILPPVNKSNVSNPTVTLSSIIRSIPSDIQVLRVDRRPSLCKTPFHDCAFLEVVCQPPLSAGDHGPDTISQLWRDKVATGAKDVNSQVHGGDLPCCRILGAW
ncbi:GPI transamidase component, partial [Rhizoctonia solani]